MIRKSCHVISNDIELYQIFLHSGIFEKVTLGSKWLQDSTEPVDILLVSSELLPLNELLYNIQESAVLPSKLFCILSGKDRTGEWESLSSILKARGIRGIPPDLTPRQIFEQVCEESAIDVRVRPNVIAFFGADTKTGVSITAQASAEALAVETDLRVCFINGSGRPGIQYHAKGGDHKGMDFIKSKLFSKVLSPEELEAAMVPCGRLMVLPGIQRLPDLKQYHPFHVEQLADLASRSFDAVILDAGCYPESGLYIGALHSAGVKFMVAGQQESSFKAFEITREQVLKVLDIDSGAFMLLINRYSELLRLPTAYKLGEAYGMMPAAILPNVPNAFSQTEKEQKTLRGMDANYDKALGDLVRIMADRLGAECKKKVQVSDRTFRLPFLKSRKGAVI